jgi:hypothetical protein
MILRELKQKVRMRSKPFFDQFWIIGTTPDGLDTIPKNEYSAPLTPKRLYQYIDDP